MKKLISLAILLCVIVATHAADSAKLNVLFIAVDDLRPELGCYGVPSVKSPNIDRLASRGVTFTRAYCQEAVCNPTRASLMTGLRPETLGVFDLPTHFRDKKPDAITIAQHFKANGYFAQRFGKIFHVGHGNRDDTFSWSKPAPDLTVSEKKYTKAAATPGKKSKKGKGDRASVKAGRGLPYAAPDCADDQLPDGQIADQAIAALRKHKDEPFFLAVGFHKPHLPFVAPKKYWDLYKADEIPTAPNPFHPHNTPLWTGNNSAELRNYSDIPDVGPISPEKIRALKHGYYAATSYMDTQLGRVLAELDRLGLRNKTVIIFWGDHGWHLGEHDMWCKHTDYEVATRVPLIISVPNQKNCGAKCNGIVEFVDIFPSLADICGLPQPSGLDGISFKPLVENPNRSWKTAAFSVWPKKVPDQGDGMGWAIRTERYRYVEWRVPQNKFIYRELYDHQADPQENENLADKPESAAMVKELSAQLKAGWKGALPKP
jgi:iduronate 2-sulfatase